MTNYTPEFTQPQLPFDEIPHGYCHCGCGQKTKLARQDDADHGHVKGQPYRFIGGHTFSPIVRFWNNVIVASPDDCWKWKPSVGILGYGSLRVNGKTTKAHRFSYELHNGPIPDGLFVCHSCDVNYPIGDISYRRCVNPAHLWLGTNAENMADMVQKGRSPRTQGDKHYKHKLTNQDVLAIRERCAAGEHAIDLMPEYNVSLGTIYHISRRHSWKHI